MKIAMMMSAASAALLLAACDQSAPADDAAVDAPATDVAAAPAPAAPAGPPATGPGPLPGWTTIGDGVWTAEGDEIVGTGAAEGMSFLATEESYSDVHVRLEFQITNPGNSGVFIRCADMAAISDTTCYEANIFDERPDQTGRTGGIPNIAAPQIVINAQDGEWHIYDITVQGDHIVVQLDEQTTVDVTDSTHTTPNPVAIQIGAGENTIRLRNIEVTPL